MTGPQEHRITEGVRGWLESPSISAIVEDCLVVSGWVFATQVRGPEGQPGNEIVELCATVLGARYPLPHGLARDDVTLVYPQEPRAGHSGFSGYIEIGRRPDENAALEIWATFDDGETLRLFKRRLCTATPAGTVSPLSLATTHVVQNPRVLVSGAAWRRALELFVVSAVRTFKSTSVVARTFRSALVIAQTLASAPVVARTFRSALVIAQTLASAVGIPVVARTFRSARRVGTPDPQDDAREDFRGAEHALLASFLAARGRLALKTSRSPTVSVVIVLWNHAELTLKCLRSLASQTDVAMEVIVVDNASTDETPDLLRRVKGLNLLRNSSNLGFTVSANRGARTARGEFLLFLNNDTELAPECVLQLVETIRRSDSIGAVGGKLVFPDGRLQEAGSIIWSDGSCDAYGRGGDPAAPEYNFERPVDFCSAALLLTRRTLFERVGGFDEGYRPAYYEDADYCVRLWTHDCPVIYQPRAVAVHHEFGSATSQQASLELQLERRPMFVARHDRWLTSQHARSEDMLAARAHPHGQPSVIVVDDSMPNARLGSGFPRAAALLRALTELGFLITIYTTSERTPSSESRASFPGVEVIAGGPDGLRAFFRSRWGPQCHHQLVIVSRPHNMWHVKAAMGSSLANLGVPCIYDAEAIYTLRDIGRRNLARQPIADGDAESSIEAETNLTRGCAAVITVSETERRVFAASGILNVSVVGHAVPLDPTPSAFHSRQTILFVGAFSSESPNEDAVSFLCHDILPILRNAGRCRAPVVVAGARIPNHVRAADPSVSWHSDVGDLTPFYDRARVFVAPTRYSAGIPLKVIEAAARGVPVVCTPRLAQQLGWSPGIELLAADTPHEFAGAVASLYGDSALWLRLRDAALSRVAKEYSPDGFRAAVQRVLDRVVPNASFTSVSR